MAAPAPPGSARPATVFVMKTAVFPRKVARACNLCHVFGRFPAQDCKGKGWQAGSSAPKSPAVLTPNRPWQLNVCPTVSYSTILVRFLNEDCTVSDW